MYEIFVLHKFGEYGVSMNKERKTTNCLAGVLIAAGISVMAITSPSYAAYTGAVLSEIEINPYHADSYQITVRTDKDIPVEKIVNSDNEIVLDLKNTRPAKFVNTIYNNASKVNHVVVQSVSNNRVKILMQGLNMSASKITLDTKGEGLNLPEEAPTVNLTGPDVVNSQNTAKTATEETITAKNPEQIVNNTEPAVAETPVEETKSSEEIILQHPVNKFKPIDTVEELTEEETDSSLGLMQGSMISTVVQKVFNTSNLDWLLRLSVFIFLIIGGIKLFKPKKKNIKIDLSGDLRSREVDLFKELNNKKGLIGPGLSDYSRKEVIKKPGYSSISNYGIKEYQNSQIPPYNINAQPVSKINNAPGRPVANDALLRSLNTQNRTLPRPTGSKITNKDINNAKVNIDSQRFLETMAKIYEKSGRRDLAQGIKHNILKNK